MIYKKYKLNIIKKHLFVLIILLLVMFSCVPDKTGNKNNGNREDVTSLILEPTQYVQWIRDKSNGLLKEKTIDEIIFSLQYKPLNYVICMEEQKQELSGRLIKQRVEELKDMEYYDFTIAVSGWQGEILKYNLESAEQYEERIKYLSFGMSNDIMLVAGNDTIGCGLFHFERTYDIVPYSRFLLGFAVDNPIDINERTIIFNDRIFNKGIIKFNYTNEEINNIPKLKTNDEI